MKNQTDQSASGRMRRTLPFFIEFVKFSAGFSLLIAVALIALNAASAAQ